jgi:uncharacterized membrane protein YhaH (DUF805 family)
MDFQTAVKSCFQKYAMFDGRSRRSEYWWFVLFLIVGNFVLSLIGDMLGLIFSLATLVPSLSAAARRLHDTDRSGWWQLIGITIIGLIPLIYWLASPGTVGANRFGEDPTGRGTV